ERQIAEFQQETLMLGQALQPAVEHALRDRQPQDLRDLLAAMVRDSALARIRILDARLKEVAGAASPASFPPVPTGELLRVLEGGPPLTRYLDIPGHPVAYVVLPLRRRGAVVGVLEIAHAATRVERQIRRARQDQVLGVGLLGLSLGLVIWFTVQSTIRQPVGSLVEAAVAFGRGDLSRRTGLRRRDEIGQLAAALDRMAEGLQAARDQLVAQAQARVDLERRIQQMEKLAAIGRLASEVAHEVGTPLNIVSGRASTIQQALPPEHPVHRHLETIFRQVERISAILRQLLDYARPRHLALQPVAVGPLLAQTADLLEPVARARGLRFLVSPPEAAPALRADPDQLQQVLFNLAKNALDATEAGEVRLSAGAGPAAATDIAAVRRGHVEGPCLALVVEDTGAGMPRDRLERIFEPFYSTKPRYGGTGLGLAVVEDVVRAHEGAIEVRSAEGKGTTVTVWWPVAGPTPEPSHVERAAEPEPAQP
ncbi:MAG TPA: ATP-binding protein, partial [Candidatus Sulfotelmatobacter sp.]|nr:ATP-binding protein [Candidatus Sulfotelmatobacter sp.]